MYLCRKQKIDKTKDVDSLEAILTVGWVKKYVVIERLSVNIEQESQLLNVDVERNFLFSVIEQIG